MVQRPVVRLSRGGFSYPFQLLISIVLFHLAPLRRLLIIVAISAMASLRTFTFYEGSGYLGYIYSGFLADAGWIQPPALAVGSLIANVFATF